MPYERISFNTTTTILNRSGMTNLFTRINDAIFLKNRYQLVLDNANAAIINQVHYLEEKSNEAKEKLNKAKGLQRSIEAHTNERINLYDTLSNLLSKETDFEKGMWKITQENNKVTSVNIKQKFHESDVDEMKFSSMLEYLKQYPTYASKSSFKDILDKIKEKESEIRKQKEGYFGAVSAYNYEISTWEKEIRKAEDKFSEYSKFLEEGTSKIAGSKYCKSIFYRMASEKTKADVNIDTLEHRIQQFKNTLDVIKKQYSDYKDNPLVEMAY